MRFYLVNNEMVETTIFVNEVSAKFTLKSKDMILENEIFANEFDSYIDFKYCIMDIIDDFRNDGYTLM